MLRKIAGVCLALFAVLAVAPASLLCSAAPALVARDWQADHDKWEQDKAVWDAWHAANDARNAAIAAEADRLSDLSTAKLAIGPTYFAALDAMETIHFQASWVWGSFGYAGNASVWLNGPDAPGMPTTMTNPHANVRSKVVAAGLDPSLWDAHVAACVALDAARAVPPVTIPPDPGPMPPDPGPEPQPPPVTAAAYVVDPGGYTVVATGQRVNDPRVLNKLLMSMKPGETADLMLGDYQRPDVKDAPRPKGSAPIVLRGVKDASGKRPKILRNVPPSGGSSTISLGPNMHAVHFQSVDVEIDDKYGYSTSWSPHDDLALRDCRIFGYFDPTDADGDGNLGATDDSLTGISWGQVANFVLEDVEIFGARNEHALYTRNRAGPMIIRRYYAHHCQRTGVQDVSRVSEGPEGVGDVLVEDSRFVDLGLEANGAGSALQCRGGNKTATWTIRNVTIEQGCDAALKFPYSQYIVGCVNFDNGSSGSYAGGTKKVVFDGVTCKMGLVHPGVGQARRSNVKLEFVSEVDFQKISIENGPAAHQIALEIAASVGTVRWNAAECEVLRGEIKYNGLSYATEAAWLAAKDPDGDGLLAE